MRNNSWKRIIIILGKRNENHSTSLLSDANTNILSINYKISYFFYSIPSANIKMDSFLTTLLSQFCISRPANPLC